MLNSHLHEGLRLRQWIWEAGSFVQLNIILCKSSDLSLGRETVDPADPPSDLSTSSFAFPCH
jgi:hypothetical protein